MSTPKTTKLLQNRRATTIISMLVLLSGILFAPVNSLPIEPHVRSYSSLADHSVSEWQGLAPAGEEFFILTPVKLSLLQRSLPSNIIRPGGEKVLEQREYSAYAGDFIFAIQSYKALHPERLMKDLRKRDNLAQTTESNVTLDGFNGKQYLTNTYGLSRTIQFYVTTQHIYIFDVTAKSEGNSAAQKFLSSIRLGRINFTANTNDLVKEETSDLDPILPASSSDSTHTQSQDEVMKATDVTRKAIIIWRPSPDYTEKARKHQLTGSTLLEAILTSSGQVKVTQVLKGLGDGLTEKAIETVKSMRFFPAEKDGRPVSQYTKIELHFNLY